MTRNEFCNLITGYIDNDDRLKAIKVISIICKIDEELTETVINDIKQTKIHNNIGEAIYARLMNYDKKYEFGLIINRYRIHTFDFVTNFEKL